MAGGAGRQSQLRASWPCAVCGESAATVTLVRKGELDPHLEAAPEAQRPTAQRPTAPGPTAERGDLMMDYDRLAIVGGPVSVTLGVGLDVPAITDALARADLHALAAIDSEFAPFWCPECDACYCAGHYLHWDVFDEGFFDFVRGRCPHGHERILMD